METHTTLAKWEISNHSRKSLGDKAKALDSLFFHFIKENGLYNKFISSNYARKSYVNIRRHIQSSDAHWCISSLIVILFGHSQEMKLLSQKWRIILLANLEFTTKKLFPKLDKNRIKILLSSAIITNKITDDVKQLLEEFNIVLKNQ